MEKNLNTLNNSETTITNLIAKKMEKITGNTNLNVNQKDDTFKYKNRELGTRTVYQESEVGDFNIGEGTNCVSLGDLAICPEFLQAIQEIEKEEGITFNITDSITINDCLEIGGIDGIDFKEIANNLGLKNEDAINIILLKIKNGLSEFLEPEFKIKLSPFKNGLYLKVVGISKQDIINKSPNFMKKIQIITQYFEEHMDEIKQSFKNIAEKERKNNTKIIKEQGYRLNDLQNQL